MNNLLSKEESDFLKKIHLNIDFDNLNDDILFQSIETLSLYLTTKCFSEEYKISEEGLICESIIDKLSEL